MSKKRDKKICIYRRVDWWCIVKRPNMYTFAEPVVKKWGNKIEEIF